MRAFIMSQFSYCPLIWMFHDRRVNTKINYIHERALRIAYQDRTSTFEELLITDNSRGGSRGWRRSLKPRSEFQDVLFSDNLSKKDI